MKYKDLVSDVTFHEEVDEVTGLSRKIVVDSPDEQASAGGEPPKAAASAQRAWGVWGPARAK